GTAVLKSADDMELRSEIVEHLQLSAEADNEPQQTLIGPVQQGKFRAGASADDTVSVAIIVGIENNSAQAIIDSPIARLDGLQPGLDAMRALRLVSSVWYPYLTRPDEFIPLSASAAADMFRNDGYDAVNDYFDGTGGLKSKLFNTWARSTAEAD